MHKKMATEVNNVARENSYGGKKKKLREKMAT